MDYPTPQKPSVRRHACATFAVVGLLLQGSPAAHMVLVEHTRCAEHGELIHGEVDHAAPGGAASAERREVRSHSNSAPQSGHDHCAHAAERRGAIAAVAATESSVLQRELEEHVVVRATPRSERHARYRLAPKSSPPA